MWTIKENSNLNSVSYSKLLNYYLINDQEEGKDKYKLILTEDDNYSFKKIIDNLLASDDKIKKFSNNDSKKIIKNYNFFKSKIDEFNFEMGYNGISKLSIINVWLERGKDDPRLIFEILNSTGLELSQGDLIEIIF